MLKLRESLMRAEANRLAGKPGFTPEEVVERMNAIVQEAEDGQGN
jgi:hypothetical protein